VNQFYYPDLRIHENEGSDFNFAFRHGSRQAVLTLMLAPTHPSSVLDLTLALLSLSLLLAALVHAAVLDVWQRTGSRRRAMETSGFSPTPFLSFLRALIRVRTSFPPQETISTAYALSPQ
jgi:hypothetical protein